MFDALISDVLVPCEQHPPLHAHEWEPFVVRRTAGEMVEVPFAPDVGVS